MEKYFKDVLKSLFRNLKKQWWLGCIFVVAAVLFVIVTTAIKINDVQDSTGGNEEEPMVGVQSMIKLEWPFENEEKTEAYEIQVNNAKENGVVLCNLVSSGDFQNATNRKLKEANLEIIKEEDYISVTIVSYNVISIKVVSDDIDKAELIEAEIKTFLNDAAKEIYDVEKIVSISNPYPTEVEIVNGYCYFKQLIDEEQQDVQDVTDKPELLSSVLSLSNIVIVLSALALYVVVVFLLTIATQKREDE